MKTRNKFLILGVIVVAAVAFYSACKRYNETGPAARSAGSTLAQNEKAEPGAEKTLYYCPMHPTYTSDKPGDCPICGMKLVPVEKEEAQAAGPPPLPPRRGPCIGRR